MEPVSTVRKGDFIILDGATHSVLDSTFVKPGKGSNFYRLKVLNLASNTGKEVTVKESENIEMADVEETVAYFVARDDAGGLLFRLRDREEQATASSQMVGNGAQYLKENSEVMLKYVQGKLYSVELPYSIALQVVESGKGGTGSLKKVVVETGAGVEVPLDIQVGDMIKVVCKDGSFGGRA